MKVRIIGYFPVLSTILIDLANIGHIIRMFQEKSSAGQNPYSYLMVILALVLWAEFYRVRTPEEKIARWTAWFGVMFNLAVLGAVYWYQ